MTPTNRLLAVLCPLAIFAAGVSSTAETVPLTVADARLVFTGVGPGPVRAREAERMLEGSPGSAKAFAEAARAAAERLDPDADIHASAEYRREVAAVMARRALDLAWQRSGRIGRAGPRAGRGGRP